MNKSLIVAIILLAVPLSVAQQEVFVPADLIQIEGDVALQGGFFYANINGAGDESRLLSVEAEHLRVEIDHDYAEPFLGDTSGGENEETYIAYEGPGQLHSREIRDGHRITLISNETKTKIYTDGLKVEPRGSESVRRANVYGFGRGVESPTIGPMVNLHKMSGYAEVIGNFSFLLQNWDAVIEHPGGVDSFWTGKREQPPTLVGETWDSLPPEAQELLGDVPRQYGGRTDWQVAYVFVTNGRLLMELRNEENGAAYSVEETRGSVDGVLTLDGSLEETGTLTFRGQKSLHFYAPEPDQLLASIGVFIPPPPEDVPEPLQSEPPGDAPPPDRTGAGADPAPSTAVKTEGNVGPAIPGSAESGSPWRAWVFGTSLVVGMFLLIALNVVPLIRIRKLEDAYDLGLYAFVLDRAPALLNSRRFGSRASLMYCIALLEKKGPEDAERHLFNSRKRSRPTGPTMDYLLARIRAAQTRFDEARAHIQKCIRAEPAFIMEIKRHATLDFLSKGVTDPGEGYV